MDQLSEKEISISSVFTRDRRPKLAAHRVRELWRTLKPDAKDRNR
jgi:hypothetical protein